MKNFIFGYRGTFKEVRHVLLSFYRVYIFLIFSSRFFFVAFKLLVKILTVSEELCDLLSMLYSQPSPFLHYFFLPSHSLWWCIFRPTQISCTPLLTYTKSAILHIRPTSTWFSICYMDFWAISAQPPSRNARPPSRRALTRNCLNLKK